jgi:hypothetical protein
MVRPLSLAAAVDQAKTPRRDGVIYLPGALDTEDMAQVEEAFAWSLESPGPRPRIFNPASGVRSSTQQEGQFQCRR